MEKREKCATKRCRGDVALIYLGKLYCQKCYERICDKEDKHTFYCELCNQSFIHIEQHFKDVHPDVYAITKKKVWRQYK